MAQRAGLRSVSPGAVAGELGFTPHAGGLWIPYPDSQPAYGRLRLDAGRPRYLAPKGREVPVYVPPGSDTQGATELYVVEAPLKALALASAGLGAVGLGGVATTLDKESRTLRLNQSWGPIQLRGRKVTIVFDAGRTENPLVAEAEAHLALALEARGAIVRVAALPFGIDGEDQGPDDFLAKEGVEALKAVFAAALSADPVKSIDEQSRVGLPGHGPSPGGAGVLDDLPFWLAVNVRGAATADAVRKKLKAMDVRAATVDAVLKEKVELLESARKSRAELKNGSIW